MTILEEIVARKQMDLERFKEALPTQKLYAEVEKMMDKSTHHSLATALRNSKTGIIAEFKRKSPSRGWINRDANPEKVVKGYEENGATATSVLTDEPYFGGCNEFVERVRPLVSFPILRKEFIIDEYQVFEAKRMEADAILLIAACLNKKDCENLARLARELQLDVLLEVHSETELDYLSDSVSVVGVNNRNLKVFKTDIRNSFALSNLIPNEFCKISESGLHSAEDLKLLRAAGFNGFLMGEQFMKEAEPEKALGELIKQLES